MSELHDAFRRHESEIAGAVEPDGGLATRVGAISTRRRRHRQVGIVAASVVGAAAVVMTAVTFWPSPEARPLAPSMSPSMSPSAPDWTPHASNAATSSTPSASPSPSPTAAPSALDLFDGPAPEPRGRDAIPWDTLAPGWFLVDWRTPVDKAWDADGWEFTFTAVEGGVYLVSPAGTWFEVAQHPQIPAPLLAWDGEGVWAAKGAGRSNVEAYLADFSRIVLESGAVTATATDAQFDTLLRPGAFVSDRASFITLAYGGDGMSMRAAGADSASMGTCGAFFAPGFDDMSYVLNPADGGHLVCFEVAADSSKTSLNDVNVATGSVTRLATFKYDAMRYAPIGWVDSSEFLFGRTTSSGARQLEAVFAYHFDTGSVEQLSLPFYLEEGAAGFYDGGARRHVVFTSSNETTMVNLYTAAGDVVAALPAGCPSTSEYPERTAIVTVSGERVLITCDALGYARLYDTATGALVGEWGMGGGRETRAFEYPDLQ